MNVYGSINEEREAAMRTVSIGNQRFDAIRERNCFYIDKTGFIKEWWESEDEVTLITRPRRFGKTLNMNMLECFFSNRYENRGDLFEGLSIWQEEKYRKLQGTYPVIFVSFADVKQRNYEDAVTKIKSILGEVYRQYDFVCYDEVLSNQEKQLFSKVTEDMSDVTAQNALKNLSGILKKYYKKNVIILLDEYDTPMQEAYLGGYWEKFTEFIRSMFNATFKTNSYLERAVMTGITRVSKESIFSDLNNLNVVTTTSDEYTTSFGFTEEEVFHALEEGGLSQQKNVVKEWYDGFTFGTSRDIYNPWSITSFLDKKKLGTYWADTSSNGLIGSMIQKSSVEIKENMELIMNGGTLEVPLDEQIIFSQLDTDENAIWSLMIASGYLKIVSVKWMNEDGELLYEPIYSLDITNREVRTMFIKMFSGWFKRDTSNYNGFVKALLSCNLEEMNYYMNKVALATFSSFDTGNHPSDASEPERFYHGFVLGLLVELRERYEVSSNRESGLGRYDVMLIPKKDEKTAFVLEFKVHNPGKENTLEDTVQSALRQIEDKKYDELLQERGVKPEDIRHYGFAFEGKEVLIGN